MKIVLQDGIKDCGICCLLSIIRYYGGDVSKEYLRELTNTTKDGVTLLNLLEASKKIGFEAIGLTGNLEEIDVNNLPCIAHVNINKYFKHYIVLYKINKEKRQVLIMDPAKGKKTISFSEFNLLSSSNYLFITPKKKLPTLNKKNIIKRIIHTLILSNKRNILIILFLTINYFVLCIVLSFHFKYLLEYSIKYKISHIIPKICLIMGIIYILKNLYDGDLNVQIGDRLINFGGEWKIVSFRELILKDCGIDIDKFETAKDLLDEIKNKNIKLEADNLEDLGRGNLIDQLYKKVSRPSIIEPTYLIKHPIDLSPLARSNDENPNLTDRFQLVVNGQEIINGYSELVDAREQEKRLIEQSKLKDQGDEEAMSIDYEYIRAMEYGMPPISGWGLGVDRFMQFLTNSQNIRDVVLYPLMRPRDLSKADDEEE